MTDQEFVSQLQTLTANACEEGILHGCVVAAGGRDGAEFRWHWGMRSVTPDVCPMESDSIFDIASLTKVVATATACGICIDRDLLDPNASVRDYLPGLLGDQDDCVYVRDLATHTSGMTTTQSNDFLKLAPADMLRAFVEAPTNESPRSLFKYACRNFVLLGMLVETVTGQPLDRFCTQEVFTPLGMVDTAFGPLCSNHRLVASEKPLGRISDSVADKAGRPIGNAGLFSTAEDLASFTRMMLNGGCLNNKRILGEAAMKWLTQPCSLAGFPARSFGYDMAVPAESLTGRPSRSSRAAYGHSGWTGQSLWIDPELDCFLIVLTNRTHAPKTENNYEQSKQYRTQVGDILLRALRG